ncbi:MAG TPA: pirin family protein [bacterium]|nr:pirin family protein [bacterium]
MVSGVIPSSDRFLADHGWLRSYHLFSFADYFDPENVSFGNLRVFNDDRIDPYSGFPMHPHRDMEIVTLVLSGTVTHADTMGNRGRVGAGEVQRMSAGVGVFHSEENADPEPLHLYQIWIQPGSLGQVPSYGQRGFPAKKNQIQPLVSGRGHEGAIPFAADAVVSRGDFDIDMEVTVPVEDGRGIFVYVTEGTISVDGSILRSGDQLRHASPGMLSLHVSPETQFVLIDVKLSLVDDAQ